jgi:hypothetical protein
VPIGARRDVMQLLPRAQSVRRQTTVPQVHLPPSLHNSNEKFCITQLFHFRFINATFVKGYVVITTMSCFIYLFSLSKHVPTLHGHSQVNVYLMPDIISGAGIIVCIATSDGLGDWSSSPGKGKIFSSPHRSDRFWGQPGLLSNGMGSSFRKGKSAGASSWTLASNWCRG